MKNSHVFYNYQGKAVFHVSPLLAPDLPHNTAKVVLLDTTEDHTVKQGKTLATHKGARLSEGLEPHSKNFSRRLCSCIRRGRGTSRNVCSLGRSKVAEASRSQGKLLEF